MRGAMKGEAAKARYPGFFRRYAELEVQAGELHAYSNHVVKGLLQTEEYARAVFRMGRPLLDEETVEQRVAARMERKKFFARRPAPLLSFVIDEHVLRRPLGGPEALRSQLEQLLLYGHERNIEIQVMPTGRDELTRPASGGSRSARPVSGVAWSRWFQAARPNSRDGPHPDTVSRSAPTDWSPPSVHVRSGDRTFFALFIDLNSISVQVTGKWRGGCMAVK
ncbi:DUF5753 domain-containing protein [Streptomyces sp. PU_AKi4]|uniref:DUF5753 domain-containing protein n=1 Tax=Streptomyces sp. PU_AKi4 TaxID=2800809 RepID=UPI003526A8A6